MNYHQQIMTGVLTATLALSGCHDDAKLTPLASLNSTLLSTSTIESKLTATPQFLTVQKNLPLNVTLASDGQNQLSYKIISAPFHGTLSGQGSQMTFTPEADFVGVDHFTYTVSRGRTESEAVRVSLSIEDENVTYHYLTEDFFITQNEHIYGPNVHEAIGGDDETTNMNPAPGDRIVLPPGIRTSDLRIWGLQGTAKRPIVIINGNGRVRMEASTDASILIDAGRYLQLSGAGTASEHYGLDLSGKGKALRLGQAYVKHIEVSYLEITGPGIGILMNAKSADTNPSELSEQVGINVNNNYVHDVGGEALYLGKSNKEDDTPPEHPYGVVKEINVSHNRIINSDYEAIQVRNTRGPGNIVHHNTVVNAGKVPNPKANDHHGVYCMDVRMLSVYKNSIKQSYKNGIHLDGLYVDANNDGLNDDDGAPASDFKLEVYNNEIVDTGLIWTDDKKYEKAYAVNINRTAEVRVFNNTMIRAKRWGVYFTEHVKNAFVHNNVLANIRVRADGDWAIIKSNADVTVKDKNEYKDNESEFLFVDWANDDFRMKAGESLTVDQADVGFAPLQDLNDVSRALDVGPDLGAFENTVPQAFDMSFITRVSNPVYFLPSAFDLEDDLSFVFVQGPAHGTLTDMGGFWMYRADYGFRGVDSFTFKANDGLHDSEVRTISIKVVAHDEDDA